MSDPFPLSDADIIDVPPPRRRRWRRWLLGAVVLLFIILSRSLAIYVSALWFNSVGYSSVYWYILKLKVALFLIFFLLTAAILRAGFLLLERIFAAHVFKPRTIIVNNQPVEFSPARYLRPLAWGVAFIFGLFAGLTMKGKWLEFAAYLNRTPTTLSDPIFQKTFGVLSFLASGARCDELLDHNAYLRYFLCGAYLLTALAAADDAEECALAFLRNKLCSNLRRPGSVSARICLARLSFAFSLLVERPSDLHWRYLYRSSLPASGADARRGGPRGSGFDRYA